MVNKGAMKDVKSVCCKLIAGLIIMSILLMGVVGILQTKEADAAEKTIQLKRYGCTYRNTIYAEWDRFSSNTSKYYIEIYRKDDFQKKYVRVKKMTTKRTKLSYKGKNFKRYRIYIEPILKGNNHPVPGAKKQFAVKTYCEYPKSGAKFSGKKSVYVGRSGNEKSGKYPVFELSEASNTTGYHWLKHGLKGNKLTPKKVLHKSRKRATYKMKYAYKGEIISVNKNLGLVMVNIKVYPVGKNKEKYCSYKGTFTTHLTNKSTGYHKKIYGR